MSGTLYIVPTPIGNLKDITLRALEVLRAVDLILCEDTRQTRKLLTHYEIEKPTESLHEHNERQKVPNLLEWLKEGKSLALVSDAGTPLISDPGFPLVRAAIEAQISVESLPGPCAAVTALAACGLPPDRFYFLGFLPNRSAPRRRALEELKNHPSTLIFYESTHRIQKFLVDAYEILGDRPVVLARELSKRFSELVRGRLGQPLSLRSWKGEFVVLIGGFRPECP
jgi:16S rRNA (cytidine1402-2'-O)-methyltransferase